MTGIKILDFLTTGEDKLTAIKLTGRHMKYVGLWFFKKMVAQFILHIIQYRPCLYSIHVRKICPF